MYKLRKYLTKLFALFVIVFALGSLQASAARFYLSPASGSFTAGCETVVNIVIDTEDQNSKGADVILNYNPAELEIVDQNADMPGVQIRAGSKSIFEIYPYNSVNTTTGKIYLAGASMFSSYKTAGNGDVYGTIVFKSKPGITSSKITFDFVSGSTTDSNISAVDSSDLLTGVANGDYTFEEGQSCIEDTKPPYVVSTVPKNGERNVYLDSNVTVNIKDDISGVNIDSVTVNIDGIDYKRGSKGFSFTGDKSNYVITIDSANNFPGGQKVNVEVDAKDIRGRIMSTYRFSFNEPIVDGDVPYITGVSPVPGTDDVPLDSNISFHLKDDISGVDIDSVEISINGDIYRNGDFKFSVPEDINDYFIIVDPKDDFSFGEPVYVQVDAVDFDGNVMPTYMFSFNHSVIDSSPPYIVSTNPRKNAKGIPLDSDISFVIRDNLSGVNFDSVNVLLEGVNYNSNHPGFSYSDDTVIIEPETNFPAKAEIVVKIDASDLRGNEMSTYVFGFNAPPVCGDNRLEPVYEECEPPGSYGCNSECKLVICQAMEESEAICGNNIVEPGEDCEPPGIGQCVDCQLPDEVEEISENQKLAYEQLSQDTDGDGLTDVVERSYGTDINNSDTDGDGYSDLEEILEFGTDPLVAGGITIQTRIVNLTDGTVIGTGKSLFVKGISHAEKTVRVFAKSEDLGTEFYLGEVIADEDNKFLVISETDLDDGDYNIIARSFEQTGEEIDESDSVKITVNSDKAIPSPEVVYLDEVKVLRSVKLVLRNAQPVVYGYSLPSSRVFMTVESKVLSSTIVADSGTGYFSVFIPKPLEVGTHRITVYAVSEDGITSEPEIVEFDVLPGMGVAQEDSNLLFWILAGIILLSLLVIVGYLMYRKWKIRGLKKGLSTVKNKNQDQTQNFVDQQKGDNSEKAQTQTDKLKQNNNVSDLKQSENNDSISKNNDRLF